MTESELLERLRAKRSLPPAEERKRIRVEAAYQAVAATYERAAAEFRRA